MSDFARMARAIANTRDFDSNLAAQEAVDDLAHMADVEASHPELKKWLVQYKVGEERYGRYGYYTKWQTYADQVLAETARDAANNILAENCYCKIVSVSAEVGGRVPKSEWE